MLALMALCLTWFLQLAGCTAIDHGFAWRKMATDALLDSGLPVASDAGLPSRSEVLAGQLVIRADFPMAAHHRLIADLDRLRVTVSQELGLPTSDEPIHLYLFEDFQHYQSFVARTFPQFPTRRAFFVETDTSLSVYAPWQDRIAEDLRHETTHGYVHAVVPAIPLWLDEGIAEYFELPAFERGLHRSHAAHLAGRLIEGTWQPDLGRMEGITSAGEMSQDHYAEAWAWVHWMLTTTPARRELLQDYLSDLRRDPASPPLSLRLRERQGPPQQLVEAMRRHVEQLVAERHTPQEAAIASEQRRPSP
jgi:hypothetical protein